MRQGRPVLLEVLFVQCVTEPFPRESDKAQHKCLDERRKPVSAQVR